MKKNIETNWNELWPIGNILNEVCHGINISNFENEIGFKYESILFLLKKITAYKVKEYESEIKKVIELNDFERDIIQKSFQEVLKEIEEWEFSTRIGISIAEANVIISKLTS